MVIEEAAAVGVAAILHSRLPLRLIEEAAVLIFGRNVDPTIGGPSNAEGASRP